MHSLCGILREAFRGLRKAPALVAICVLSLGLGVGVNLTLFSWLSAMFFDRPTIARPGEVVGIEPGNSNQFSYLNYRDLKDARHFRKRVREQANRAESAHRRGDAERAGPRGDGKFLRGARCSRTVRPRVHRCGSIARARCARRSGEPCVLAPHAGRRSQCDRARAESQRPAVHAARRARARLSRRRRRSNHPICTFPSTCSARRTFPSGATTTRSPSWQGSAPAWASTRRDRS